MEIQCECGKFKALLTKFPANTPGRLRCYCDDCQAYLHHLNRADLLDVNGGTEIIPVYPRDFKIQQGKELLRCTRLGEHGMFRFSTTCCNTPVANTDMSNLSIENSEIRSPVFKDCKLVGVNWTAAASVMHPEWQGSVLNYGNFGGIDLRKAKMKSCHAREADFADTNFTDADLRATDFTGARFASTNLTKADLRQATNYSIRPDSNKLKGAKFSLPEATLLLYGMDIVLEE